MTSAPRTPAIYIILALFIATAIAVTPFVRAADQPIDLDENAANGDESRVSTKVLQTYPVTVENTITNNAAGESFTFKWPGAGPGGFNSFVTAGPGVGTKWVWSSVYQVYTIDSSVSFAPARSVPVFGAPPQGVEPVGGGSDGTFAALGKSIFPNQVTISDASLSASLITFFSPDRTVATCGVQCEPGQCEISIGNLAGGVATVATQQLGCCNEPNQTFCEGNCTSYLTDPLNCGGCGNVCGIDEFCSNGACVCPAGLDQCGAGCIDLQSDPDNCGACGNACASDEFCADGGCLCDAGLTQCGAGCTDLLTDALNCGTCGNACPVGGFCSNGGCSCPAGQTDCGGVCVDLSSDQLNCGGCGNTCETNDICTAGTCQGCRPPLQTSCDNQCVNIHTDPYNCGGCGSVCDFTACPSTGTGTCSMGDSCVCDPAPTGTRGTALRFSPVPTQPVERNQTSLLRQSSTTMPKAGSRSVFSRQEVSPVDSGASTAEASVATTANVLNVIEAPVCDLAPILQIIPPGGTYTQTQQSGRFGKEIQTTVSIEVDGEMIAQGPCPLIVPVTGVDTSGIILSPTAVSTRDESGDGLCQPGEAWCDYHVTVADVGDTPCIDPLVTLSSAPDQFNLNEVVFLNSTSTYPTLPAYPGDGVPLEKRVNDTAYSITTQMDQAPDVGRPFLLSFDCTNQTAIVEVPIVLGIGSVCDPNAIDGETYDRVDGFEAPVKARLVAEGNPVNFSTGQFNQGSTIPLHLSLGCGSQVLSDAEINPNPMVYALEHTILGPQSLDGINGDNNANPDDPSFSCGSSGCDYQFRTEQLPVGTYIISIQMPDTRVFQAGFTIKP